MDRPSPPEPAAPPLESQLERWLGLGLLTADQAEGIRRAEGLQVPIESTLAQPAPRSGSVLAEALGYCGGALVLVALALLGAQTWNDLGTTTRLALLGFVTAVFLVAGALSPVRRPDGSRLRAVFWTLAVVSTAGLLAVLASRVLDLHGARLALLIGSGCLALAGVLWWRHRVGLLQAATLAAAATTAAAVVQLGDGGAAASGAAVWVLGWAWLMVGRRGSLPPPRAATLLGPCAVVGGCIALNTDDVGRFVVLLTLVALVALAVHWRDLWLLGVGAAGSLFLLPGLVGEWFPGLFAASAALLTGGVLLLVAAVHIASRPREA